VSQQVERVDLGDAGSVTLAIGPAGAVVESVDPAPPWRCRRRHPRGWFARRRPAAAVLVVLEGPGRGAVHEVELGLLRDRTWELAVQERWTAPRAEPVDTPAGRVVPVVTGGRLGLVSSEPLAGWRVRRSVDDGEVVVVFTRGTEEWEVVLRAGDGPADPVTVEREHRRRLRRAG
jgi:hypothetical protein